MIARHGQTNQEHNVREPFRGDGQIFSDPDHRHEVPESDKDSCECEGSMDNKTNRGEPDRSKINVNEPYELKYWAEKFGVPETELRLAVHKAGTNPDAVQRALGK